MQSKKVSEKQRKKHPGKYPPEIREQAVELFYASAPNFKNKTETALHVCELLGIGCDDTVLNWVRQAEIDAGKRQGATSEELEEIRHLKRENAELKRANAILKAASAFFAAELDRPLNK